MEKIKVGEYIRTREPYGEIFKVIGIGEKDVLVTDSYENNLMATDWVEKHSPNIIDVLEIGDIVTMKYRHLDVIKPLDETDIADLKSGELKFVSVVTHQQFNSIKYEVI